MRYTSIGSHTHGIAMVGGAIAMAILDLLVKKNVLTVDDVQGALKKAQGSLINAPAVRGSTDGARIIGEMTEQFTRLYPDKYNASPR
jgi:hypothetical protein